MARQKDWGDQLRIFRLEAGYESQGAWVEATSKLVAALSPQEFVQLQSEFDSDEDAFDISQTMISRWETGARKPPRDRSRHLCLIWMLAELGGIHTHSEANLWLSMADLKPLMLDEQGVIWPHQSQLASQTPSTPERSLPDNVVDWGAAPRRTLFLGRAAEQAQLENWLLRDRCRLIGIWGIGGQGKTTLAAEMCHHVSADFDSFIWRSLLNAPPLDEILASWIQLLSNRQLIELPKGLDGQFNLLFELLRSQRTLLVLDNAESILAESGASGGYRSGYELYGQLFLRFGEASHQSCLIVTSREQPREFTQLGRRIGPEQDPVTVQSLSLDGLDLSAGEALLAVEELRGTPESIRGLYERYSGNPLALMIVSSTIAEFYGGDADLFLSLEPKLFGDVRELLAQHIERLTNIERSILYWLAIEREPITVQTLHDNLVTPAVQSELLIALQSLQRRSLIEKYDEKATKLPRFALQNVITEYLTAEIIEKACNDFSSVHSPPDFLHHHALLMATSKSYIHQAQERLILEPVAQNLLASLGRGAIRTWVETELNRLRTEGKSVGYTAGNVLNLLLHLQEDLADLDFSHLPVWQVSMEDREIKQVNFAHADLSNANIYESLGRVRALVFHPSGELLFAGTTHGQIGGYRIPSLQPLTKESGPIQHIRALGVSQDGKTLFSSGDDGIVRLWDIGFANGESMDSPKERAKPTGYLRQRDAFTEEERVRAAIFCLDDTIIALGLRNDIRLWDVETQTLVTTLIGHQGAVSCLAYSSASGLLATSGGDARIRLWQLGPPDSKNNSQHTEYSDVQTDGLLAYEPGNPLPFELAPIAVLSLPSKAASLAMSADGQWIAGSSLESSIYLWNVEAISSEDDFPLEDEISPMFIYSGHRAPISTLAFSPDSQLLASGSADQTIRLWELASGQTRHLLQGHRNDAAALQFSPDGAALAVGNNDRTLRLWEVESGRELRRLGSYADGSMSALAASSDGQRLISGSDDGTVRIWNLSKRECEWVLHEQTNYIFAVAYSPDGSSFASASMDRTICQWDAETGALMHKLVGHSAEIASVGYHPELPILLSGSSDRTLRLWDTRTGEPLQVWSSPGGSIWDLAFSPNGEHAVLGASSGAVYIWSFKEREVTNTLKHHEDVVWAIDYSLNGKLIASAGFDGKICLWDAVRGTVVDSELNHGSWVRSLAFSPDSRLLISTGDNQEVCVWDLTTSQESYRCWGKDAAVFHPGGHFFAASADQWLINLWNVEDGKPVGQLEAEGPFYKTNITGVKGLSPAQKEALRSMGAELGTGY